MKLTSDGQTLVSVAQDGILLLWDASTGLKINAVALSNCWVIACAVSPSGRLVSTGGLDNACTVYGIDTIDDEMSTTSGQSSTSTITNNRKATKSQPGSREQGNYQMAGLWPHSPHGVLKGHKGYISSMAFPAEDRLLSASGDMTVAYWDIQRNQKITEFSDRNLGDVNALCAHPTNPHIFVSGSLKSAKVWDIRVPIASMQEFIGHEDDINVVK